MVSRQPFQLRTTMETPRWFKGGHTWQTKPSRLTLVTCETDTAGSLGKPVV